MINRTDEQTEVLERDTDLWFTCIHEGGHAVMVRLLGVDVQDAVAKESENGKQKYGGCVNVAESNNPAVNICILLSGIVTIQPSLKG